VDIDYEEAMDKGDSFKTELRIPLADYLFNMDRDLMALEGEPCYACVQIDCLEPGSTVAYIDIVLEDSLENAKVKEFRVSAFINHAALQMCEWLAVCCSGMCV
jgi:hypothetical protein